MPGDDDLNEGAPEGDGIAGAANLTLTPEQIRSSPEFRALEKQNRTLARQKGAAEAAAAAARSTAETARQAAEAQQQAAVDQQLRSTIGEDGIAAYNEIAALSATDPVAAATRLAEFVAAARGQTPPVPDAAPQAPSASGTEGNVANASNTTQTPAPPVNGAGGGQPLGQAQTGEDMAAIIANLENTYKGVVERNQNVATRNRVTMKDRASALISYVGAAYLKAGATPKSK